MIGFKKWDIAALFILAAVAVSVAAPPDVSRRVRPPDSERVARQHIRLEANSKLVEGIRQRVAVLDRGSKAKLRTFCYCKDGKSFDAFNGQDGSKPVSIRENQQFLHSIEVTRLNGNDVGDYTAVNEIAADWWRDNQNVNLIPLKVAYIQYHKMFKDSLSLKISRYVSVEPHMDYCNSQLVTFGCDAGLFTTNTNVSLKSITLTIDGLTYTLLPGTVVIVPFKGEGAYTVSTDIVFSNNEKAKSSFVFNINRLADGSWSNSTTNGPNGLDFISKE
jgi:hypothetical protein